MSMPPKKQLGSFYWFWPSLLGQNGSQIVQMTFQRSSGDDQLESDEDERWTVYKRCQLDRIAKIKEDQTRTPKVTGEKEHHHLQEGRNQARFMRLLIGYVRTMTRINQLNLVGSGSFLPSVKWRHLPWWSKLYEAFFVYFTIKLFLAELIQHEYNSLWIEANEQIRIANQNSSALVSRRTQDELKRATERLNLIGSPWREANRPLEIIYVFVLVIVVIVYAGIGLFTHLKGPINIGLLRFIVNPNAESAYIHSDICRLARTFLMSSRNFLRNRRAPQFLSEISVLEKKRQRNAIAAATASIVDSSGDLRGQFHNRAHTSLKRNLSELGLSGHLTPFNRTEEWHGTISPTISLLLIATELVGLFVIMFVLYLFPASLLSKFTFSTGDSDLLFFAEMIVYCLFGLQFVSFHLATLVSICVDQVKYALELSQTIQSTIREIDMTQQALNVPDLPTMTNGGIINNLNTKIITILIHFKMFRWQLAATQQSEGYAVSAVVLFMILVPVMGHATASHLDPQVKVTLVFCSCIVIMLCDAVIGPNCHLYARCLDLYRDLTSLLAHLVAVTRVEEGGGQQQVHSAPISWSSSGLDHTQWLLRRELSMPDGLLDRFATNGLFFKITYSNFMGVHFWCGILLISLWLKTASSSTGNTLADSFVLI